jgi:hypothetical protein
MCQRQGLNYEAIFNNIVIDIVFQFQLDSFAQP